MESLPFHACVRTFLVVLLLLLLLLHHDAVGKGATVLASAVHDASKVMVIAAYLPDYRVEAVNLNASAPFLTDLVLFSIQPHAHGFVSGCCLEEMHYGIARGAREYKRQVQQGGSPLRLWVSVGGGGRSDAFPIVAADPKRRSRLIDGLVQLCDMQDLDGIDFDWEAPRSQEEYQHYLLLLKEASEALHHANRLVSLALHPRQFLPPLVYDWVDRVHLMTYDMSMSAAAAEGAGPSHHHAAHDRVVDEVVAFVEQGRCPRSKLVLGLPAYARHESNPGQTRTFSELMTDSNDVAASRNSWNGYRYDGPDDIRQKVEYAASFGLKGVFFWELGQDKQHEELGPGGILLEAAARVVNRPARKKGGREEDEL